MIAVVYGTRPEAIKLFPVVDTLRERGAEVRVICTGQHEGLLDEIPIHPDVNLALMKENQAPSAFVASAMTALDKSFTDSRPEFVLVQGDTASAFAGALAAFHHKIPSGHVEAGLRTYRLDAPFPEEGYRQMVDRIATRLYAPTEKAKSNLLTEGRLDVLVTGNTGIDAALSVKGGECWGDPPFVLATLHRREAIGEKMKAVGRALIRIARTTDMQIVVPLHPNPNVQAILREMLKDEPRVRLVRPLNYPDFIATMKKAACVVTDSGGIQEEAPNFGVPVLVARETTERPEAVEAGSAALVGFDETFIVALVTRIRSEPHHTMTKVRQIFGDGRASGRIAADLGFASG